MTVLLCILAVVAFSAVSISTRILQLNIGYTDRMVRLYQGLYCLVGATAYFVTSSYRVMTISDVGKAVLFGVFFAAASLLGAVCMKCGPMSLTSVITNASVLIPLLFSMAVFHDRLSALQYVGMALLFATFGLSALSSKSVAGAKVNVLWLVLVSVSFFSNGTTAVVQKLYKAGIPDGADGNFFMSAAYFTASVILLTLSQVNLPKDDKGEIFPRRKRFLFITLIFTAGFGSFIGNGILMSLSTVLPAAQLYPFINGGLCVFVSICSLVFFREKVTLTKVLTILVGLSSIICLNL